MQIWKYAADQAECMAGMQEEDADAVNNSYRSVLLLTKALLGHTVVISLAHVTL